MMMMMMMISPNRSLGRVVFCRPLRGTLLWRATAWGRSWCPSWRGSGGAQPPLRTSSARPSSRRNLSSSSSPSTALEASRWPQTHHVKKTEGSLHRQCVLWCDGSQVKTWWDWEDRRYCHHRSAVFHRALLAWPRPSISRGLSGKDAVESSALTGSAERVSPSRAPSTSATCGTATTSLQPAEMHRSHSIISLQWKNSESSTEGFMILQWIYWTQAAKCFKVVVIKLNTKCWMCDWSPKWSVSLLQVGRSLKPWRKHKQDDELPALHVNKWLYLNTQTDKSLFRFCCQAFTQIQSNLLWYENVLFKSSPCLFVLNRSWSLKQEASYCHCGRKTPRMPFGRAEQQIPSRRTHWEIFYLFYFCFCLRRQTLSLLSSEPES